MELREKLESFETELNFIVNPQIRLFAERAIGILPDYFWTVPASSSGKYHPVFATGVGGLLKHTKAAARIAVELFRTGLWELTGDEKDLILVSLMIHDGFKLGKEKELNTRFDHPKIIAYEISHNEKLRNIISGEQMNFVVGNTERHMGRWVSRKENEKPTLEKPKTVSQRLVHLADYLASRKCIEFNFDAEISKN